MNILLLTARDHPFVGQIRL